MAHPKLVVADEPTGDLDAHTSGQILELLGRLNRELEITLVMVTHDRQAAGTAGRQLILVGGKLIESGQETGAGVLAGSEQVGR